MITKEEVVKRIKRQTAGCKEMITKEQVVKRIRSQIAVCKEIDSDWMSLTVGTMKRILELLEEQDEQEEKKIKMMRYIADLQLSIGGLMDPMTDYEQGQYDGLQMIFDMLAEEKDNGRFC